jgi:hypothetical protein
MDGGPSIPMLEALSVLLGRGRGERQSGLVVRIALHLLPLTCPRRLSRA